MELFANNIIKLIFFLFSIILFNVDCYAQNINNDSLKSSTTNLLVKKRIDKTTIQILKILGNHLNKDLLFSINKNNVMLCAIAIDVNKDGIIEHINFSDNLSSRILAIINPNQSLKLELSKSPIADERYKNKMLILTILFKRPDDNSVSNLSEFLTDYLMLWPRMDRINPLNKQLVLLQPFINDYFDTIR